jgi:hypothetical protein
MWETFSNRILLNILIRMTYSFFYQVFLKNKIMIGYKIHRFFLFKVMELEYILKNLSLHMGLILFQLFFLSLQILIQIQQRINYYYSFQLFFKIILYLIFLTSLIYKRRSHNFSKIQKAFLNLHSIFLFFFYAHQ